MNCVCSADVNNIIYCYIRPKNYKLRFSPISSIQSIKSGMVTLTIRCGDGKLPRDLIPKRSTSSDVVLSSSRPNSHSQAARDSGGGRADGETAAAAVSAGRFEVTLVKEAGRPIGLQLTDVKQREGALLQGHATTAVAIRNIAPNSPAKRCGNLM